MFRLRPFFSGVPAATRWTATQIFHQRPVPLIQPPSIGAARRDMSVSLASAASASLSHQHVNGSSGEHLKGMQHNYNDEETAIPALSSSSIITLAKVRGMPKRYESMTNDMVLMLAALGDQEARAERVIREVMEADGVEWAEARKVYRDVAAFNRSCMTMPALPYYCGITAAVSAGFLSVPMVFELNTVLLFNEMFVTSDVPEPKDLETFLEVGSWAWGWMEPPLGQISFFLLCMQYARAQLQNIGAKPYTEWLLERRARKLVARFPKYDRDILTHYSKGVPIK